MYYTETRIQIDKVERIIFFSITKNLPILTKYIIETSVRQTIPDKKKVQQTYHLL